MSEIANAPRAVIRAPLWVISKIVRNLEGLGENEIPTSMIGKFIMKDLSNLDQVAYVRFASVYKNFKEAKDFEQFIGNLNEYKTE